MLVIPPPDEVERGDPVSLDVVVALLRQWRNHWAAVERVYDDLPDAVQHVVSTRPTGMAEALEELVTQHAVRVHPDAASTFVAYLNAAIRAVEACREHSTVALDPPVDRRAGAELDG